MGWTYVNYRPPGLSHAEFFSREFFRPPSQGGTTRIVDSAYVSAEEGSVFYAAVATDSDETEVWALIVLTRGRAGSEFGWKEMDETMGPAEDCCPARILDLLTETENSYALEWRQRCRDRIEHIEAVHEGVRVVFSADFLTPSGPRKQFVALDPKGGIFRTLDGETYRLRGWRRSNFELVGQEP